MHVIHKPDPIPWSEIIASQREARELRRKMMGNYAEEDMVTKKMDEDRIIHELSSDLSEEIYLAALELMKERFALVKTCHDEWQNSPISPPYKDVGTIFLTCIQLAIEAEAKRQSETNNS